MKLGKYFVFALAVAASLVMVAQAAETNHGNLTLSEVTQVGSQQVKPGAYIVEWEGTGPSVQVKVLRGKKVVASGTANLVQEQTPSVRDEVHLKVQENGARTVERIDFAKHTAALVFSESQPSSGQ